VAAWGRQQCPAPAGQGRGRRRGGRGELTQEEIAVFLFLGHGVERFDLGGGGSADDGGEKLEAVMVLLTWWCCMRSSLLGAPSYQTLWER